MVDAAKGVLGEYSQDIYLYTDVYKGAESGLSPGYGLSLVAESDTGAYYSAELCAEAMETPEDLGQKCAHMLLSEVSKGGYFDTYHHWIPLLFMTLSSEDVSKTIVGELNPFTVQVQQSKAYPGMVDLTCVGTGYTNVNKKTL
ncbi:RNA 3'-terminal phosphate cyclase-like protein [Zancudomyces culisetae]|uniref:RNA 3'-terminal phosphate cyclase-like protein n=1 Tax=Zancudomyces culisetae TaxID=1213189 RepID=A0A1R1PSH8_ZANCU|nr:RNA 3'-terminal phosphate cyclase-like protein [Zancudomyces culisetae]|eukprot:OMH83904.1 RNA 3'-terminal phosphate cyclase-like protein [Zancudomyces culisetae]